MPAPTRSTGLHATELGESGSLVALCHGLFGQGKNWTGAGKKLAERHRVLLVDMPHHGRSAWSDRFDYVEAADQVAGLLSPDDPAALVGHSMGGKIAMIVALRYPELVERLCVVDVSPVVYRHGSEFAGYIGAMQAIDLTALARRSDAEAQLLDAVPNPVVRSFLLQNLRHHGDEWSWQVNLGVLGRDLASLSGWPEHQLTGTGPYRGPVLWVAGERSDYVRDEHAEAMDRWFPKNRRATIKGAGHWVHSEQPEVFLEVLQRFLA